MNSTPSSETIRRQPPSRTRHRVLAQDLVAGHLVDVHAAPVLDDALGDRNISSVEQEFQPTPGTQVIDRGAQLLALVLEAEAPRAAGRARRRRRACRRAPRRACSARSSATGWSSRRGCGARSAPVRSWPATPAAGSPCGGSSRPPSARWPRSPTRRGRRSTSPSPAPGGVEHLAQVESRHYLGTSALGRPPRALPLLARTARCCSPSRPPAPTEGPLEPLTSRTITEPALLAAELASVRREGFATAVDELELGLSAVAAPGARRVRPRRRGAQRVRPDAAALAAPRRGAATDRDQAGAGARGALGHRPEGVHAE